MKKLNRFREIERAFGSEFVLPYRACYTLQEAKDALAKFHADGVQTGIRTDTPEGTAQGLLLPFVHCATEKDAERLWDEWKDRLVYIVYESLPNSQTLCNVSAHKLEGTLLLVEYDDGNCPQRAWETVAMPLYHAFCDRWDGWYRPVGAWGMRRVVPPWAMPSRTEMQRMYEVVLAGGLDETVWTVRTDGRVVIW